jgi:anti-sigma B factor antagonist
MRWSSCRLRSAATHRAQIFSGTLLAYGLSQHYRQIFELTRPDEAIGIHDSEAAALAAADAR